MWPDNGMIVVNGKGERATGSGHSVAVLPVNGVCSYADTGSGNKGRMCE